MEYPAGQRHGAARKETDVKPSLCELKLAAWIGNTDQEVGWAASRTQAACTFRRGVLMFRALAGLKKLATGSPEDKHSCKVWIQQVVAVIKLAVCHGPSFAAYLQLISA